MPNHVINEVVFDRRAAEHPAIIAAACDAEGKVDFGVLLPMPANVWRGSVSRRHSEAFGADCIGLDWARTNWGTKWNAYDHKPTEADDRTLTLRFETAWSPPYPWLVALFNTCGDFRHNWLSEGGGSSKECRFVREGRFGPEWIEADADEALHRHLHKLLWGVEEFEDEEA